MALFEMTGDELRALEVPTFKNEAVRERQDLQRLLQQRSDVIDVDGAGLLVIVEEFSDRGREPLGEREGHGAPGVFALFERLLDLRAETMEI